MARTKTKFPDIIGAALIGARTFFSQIIFPFSLLSVKIFPVPVVTTKKLSLTANPPLIIPILRSLIFFFNFFVHLIFPFFLLKTLIVNYVSIV